MAVNQAGGQNDAPAGRSGKRGEGAFLGLMSHKLRTPLHAIGAHVELMEMEHHGPVTKAQHVGLARIKANRGQ